MKKDCRPDRQTVRPCHISLSRWGVSATGTIFSKAMCGRSPSPPPVVTDSEIRGASAPKLLRCRTTQPALMQMPIQLWTGSAAAQTSGPWSELVLCRDQIPAFTTLCLNLRPLRVILPVIAAVYCLDVWFRRGAACDSATLPCSTVDGFVLLPLSAVA
jgi:hypothetical protein